MQLDLWIKRVAMKFGVDVRAYSPARSEAARLAKLLDHYKIDLVLDVGANNGQYARHLRSIGYKGGIVCFEPLNSAYEALTKYVDKDPRITVAPRMALGEYDGVVSINVAANSESSSILTVSDIHLQAEPGVRSVGLETVQLSRLDTVAPNYMPAGKEVFLKIDVQGYELPVLRGAAAILPKIRGIQLELSLEPLYEGESLYRDVIDEVESIGFALHDINPCFSNDVTGRTYQLDGVFFRK